MNEKVKALLEKLKEFFGKISKKTYIIALVALIVVAAVIVVVLNNKPYAVLVTSVSQDEASSIANLLTELGVADYKVEGNDTILVPKDKETTLKAKLLMEGYPKTGFSYSPYYDHVGALSTESERNKAYLLMVQDNMAAVIRCFDNVKDAKVMIAQGEDRGYVLDSGNVVEASASVIVTMQDNAKLSGKQADAIRSYVAHGVQGLQIDKVAITDTMGNNYGSSDETADSDASDLKLRLEEEWENKIRTEVLKVLVPFYGDKNVRVGVNCVVDVNKTTEQQVDYYLPPWAEDGSTDGRGVIASERHDYYAGRPGEEGEGGVVGTTTNSDLPEYVEDLSEPQGSETAVSGSGQTDYANSSKETHKINSAGVLQECSISVSLNSQVVSNINVDEVRRHVARAAGIHGRINPETGEEILSDQISVVAMGFYNDESPVVLPDQFPIPGWMLAVAGGAVLLIGLIVFLIIKLIKKKKKKKLAEQIPPEELSQLLASGDMNLPVQDGADVMSLRSDKNIELRQDIRKFAGDNPEIAAQMVHTWLRGGEEDG